MPCLQPISQSVFLFKDSDWNIKVVEQCFIQEFKRANPKFKRVYKHSYSFNDRQSLSSESDIHKDQSNIILFIELSKSGQAGCRRCGD